MGTRNLRKKGWKSRVQRIRKKIFGSSARPRLCVYRSGKHIYGQLVDDAIGQTLVSASSLDKELKGEGNATRETAKKVGTLLAKRAIDKKIGEAVFDRHGFLYHGQVKALADAAREGGLKF